VETDGRAQHSTASDVCRFDVPCGSSVR
jgi:hypothetical protein